MDCHDRYWFRNNGIMLIRLAIGIRKEEIMMVLKNFCVKGDDI